MPNPIELYFEMWKVWLKMMQYKPTKNVKPISGKMIYKEPYRDENDLYVTGYHVRDIN